MKQLWIYYPDEHEKHFQAGHPERPARIEAVKAGLEHSGFWNPENIIEPFALNVGDLSNTHSKTYLQEFETLRNKPGQLDHDTYLTNHSHQLALNSAGGAVAIASKVQEHGGVGLALCRPPGHHATRDFGMGFCLLNNIAVAANHLIHHLNISPIMLIDIDLHHGNGTEDIFYEDEKVHCVSIHQYPFYPGTGADFHTGEGLGEGTNLNIPIPAGAGDAALIESTEKLILPFLDRIKPKAVLISLGFDGHWMDPLGELNYSEKGYFEFFKRISAWIRKENLPGISLILEGGYSLDALAYSTQASIKALLDLEFVNSLGEVSEEDRTSWKSDIKNIQLNWNF